MRWWQVKATCMACKTEVGRGEYTCGAEKCELGALESQAMLAPLFSAQGTGDVQRVRFRPAATPPHAEPA